MLKPLFRSREKVAYTPSVEGIEDHELQKHLEKAEEALVPFDRVGYMVWEGLVDADLVMENI